MDQSFPSLPAQPSNAGPVDREHGIVSRVRLVGQESRNGLTYPEKVMQDALHQYDGVKVFWDHQTLQDPKSPAKRSPKEAIGVIKHPRWEEGALWGDVHVFPSDPHARKFLDYVEKAPESIGFSHHIVGASERTPDGHTIMRKIFRVVSMDLTDHPATNKNLFEQEEFSLDTIDAWKQRFPTQISLLYEEWEHTRPSQTSILPTHESEALESRLQELQNFHDTVLRDREREAVAQQYGWSWKDLPVGVRTVAEGLSGNHFTEDLHRFFQSLKTLSSPPPSLRSSPPSRPDGRRTLPRTGDELLAALKK